MADTPDRELPPSQSCANPVGYIVPAYNYVLDPVNPYFDEPPGHHYEETYSLGPHCEEQLQYPMMRLAQARPGG